MMSDNYLQVSEPGGLRCLSGAELELVLQPGSGGEGPSGRRVPPGRLRPAATPPRAGTPAGARWPACRPRPVPGLRHLQPLQLPPWCRGCQGARQPPSAVFCYNPLTGIWDGVPPEPGAPHCRLVALDGQLYRRGAKV